MATNTFLRIPVQSVGTSPQTISMPGGKKAIVIGFTCSNLLGSTLPILGILSDVSSVHTQFLPNVRVLPGGPYEMMKGNKMVVMGNDTIILSAPLDGAFDCIISILSDVQ
jgi:hypothetical protein